MRDGLIELLDNATVEKTQCYPNGIPALMYCEKAVNRNTAIQLADKILADGWTRLPCKVGDTVYVITTKVPCYACNNCSDFCHKTCPIKDKGKRVVKRAKVYSVEFGEINKIHTEIEGNKRTRVYNYTWWFDDIGKAVFFSEEEAEKALKGGD